MANIRHNLKNLLLKGKSFVSVINSSKENILNGNLDKRGWQSVSAGGSDDFAGIFLSATGITDPTITSAVYTLVNDLNGYGLWSKMKAIYPMVGGNATAHSYNLKDTTKFQITWYGGLTHSSNGVLPNGTTGYGNTNFNPNSNITTNSAHHSFYFRTSLSIGRNASIGIANMSLAPYSFNIGWVNDMFDGSASRISANVGNSTGYVIGTRSSSSSHKLFRNNTQIANTTAATTGTPPNANYFIGASNISGTPTYYDSNEMAMITLGEGLSDTEAANLYTSIQKFQTTLGRYVGTPIVSDPDAQAFLNSASITSLTQANAINTLVTDLKGANLWTKMLGIYPLVGGTASSHAWNLRDITKLKMRWVGGMTHDSNGVTGNGTNSYGQPDITGTTGINATNYPPLTATNYGISLYQRNTSAEYVSQVGFGYTDGHFSSSYSGGTTNYFRGIAASTVTGISANTIGLFHMYGGSGTGSGIFNGTKIATGTGGQLPNPALGTFLWFAGANGIGYSNRNFAFFTVSEYLNDTEAANLYTKIQNYQISLGRSVGPQTVSDPDAQLFINTANIQDQIQATAVNTLVTDLKSNNLWTKMKAVYPMVGGTATSHSYNLKNPSQFQITWNGGITHSSTGVLFNGTTGYGNTNFNPTSELNISSNFMSQYIRTNNSDAASSMGCFTGIGQAYTLGIDGTNVTSRNTSAVISGSTATRAGLSATVRTSFSINGLFKNSTKIFTGNTESGLSYPSYNIFIGQFNFLGSPYAGYYSANEYAFATIGDGLTDAESSTLYTIIQNYQTILSRNI